MLAAHDPTHVGLKGVLVDETLNTLVLRSSDGTTRRIAKAHALFAITTEDGPVAVPGDRIRFRPEDRIKKVR